jgi:hypothetical protein
MAVTAVPYLRPTSNLIEAGEWQVLEEEPRPLPELLPHWDYNTDVKIGRTISLQVAEVRAACRLTEDDALKIIVVWHSPGSFQRGVLCTYELDATEDRRHMALRGTLRGSEIVGSVKVDTFVVLGARPQDPQPLTPTHPGSILWQDSASVLVEGTGPRFPMEVIDFGGVTWAPSGAAWVLVWNPFDVDQPFLGAVRLFLNAAHEQVVRAATTAATDLGATAIRSAIYFDVGRALLRGALSNPDFLSQFGSFPRGSTGHAIATLLRTTFPGEPVLEIRNLMTERPDFFDSVLQSKFNLFQA